MVFNHEFRRSIHKKLYYYKEGYIRTSSFEYTLDNLSENYVHLTNNCLQKHGNMYGKHEEGNTLPFEKMEEFFNSKYPNLSINFQNNIIPRIKDIIIDCYLATKGELNPKKRKNCFELVGFDFILDEDFHVWLLEVF